MWDGIDVNLAGVSKAGQITLHVTTVYSHTTSFFSKRLANKSVSEMTSIVSGAMLNFNSDNQLDNGHRIAAVTRWYSPEVMLQFSQ